MTVGGKAFQHGADLPWGWWLRAEGDRVVDADGRAWRSVREAFWEGRIGMRSAHLTDEQLELLLRVLGSLDRSPDSSTERWHDIFDGDAMFWRFYMTWLGSVGLLDIDYRADALCAPLAEEGRAVLRMLRATRQPAWADIPMRAVTEEVARANRDAADGAREAALLAFERGMTPAPHVFARERVGRAYLVTLTTFDLAERIPVRRRSWSASFLDERRRDDLFGWLAERVHRWEDWGAMAHARGAGALTAHLLGLLVAHPAGRRVDQSTVGADKPFVEDGPSDEPEASV